MTKHRPESERTRSTAEIVISRTAQPVSPVVQQIASNLAQIDAMRIVKITPSALEASSETCGTRKQPVTKPGHPTAIGVSLIVAEEREEIQFYEITSAVKGYGSRMVGAVLNALPRSWRVYVLMDWSDGFWKVMRRRHRRIVVV